jgi:hypothetical protein
MEPEGSLPFSQKSATGPYPEADELYFCKKKKKGKVVPVLNLIKYYAMKAYGGVDV